MLFSEHWLRKLVNPKLSRDELLHQLTMAGLEIDGYKPAAGDFTQVVVGEVLSVEKHPDADKLSVCKVKTADDAETLQIVCGADNVREGLKVPVALVGAVLPGGFKIKKSKLRGVESFGMLCAASELGLAESSSGLMELPKVAPLGDDLKQYLKLDDTIIEVDLTPNRGDCLGMLGLAREVGVLNHLDVNYPEFSAVKVESDKSLKVEIKAGEACPRYVGRVITDIDVSVETPLWMVERLRRGGIRSIDAVVDVTNYVLLECGQPMHAFDLEKIKGSIQVRMAEEKEKLVILDGQELELNSNSLVIADSEHALALAGIMGGAASGVTANTKNIFLESAFFAPVPIAGKARSYGLHTDSSHRFERGVDSELQLKAIERATELLLEIVGGQAGPITEAISEKDIPKATKVTLRKARVKHLLGIEMTDADIEEILQRLGMAIENKTDQDWLVKVPSYRFDISLEVDLLEELGRIYGYNNLPAAKIETASEMPEKKEGQIDKIYASRLLASLGYQESICYSFIDKELQQLIDPDKEGLVLANPLSADLAVMRTSLWPGLLKTLSFNLNRQQHNVRIFETGLVFIQEGEELVQKKMIAGLISGNRTEDNWENKAEEVDFFDLKGDVESLLELGGMLTSYDFEADNHTALHPGQSAKITRDGEVVGYLGALHPDIKTQLNLDQDAYIFEISADIALNRQIPKFKPVSKFPETTRDIAVIVDKNAPGQGIIRAVEGINSPILQKVAIFDVYEGENIGKDQKSVAISLTLQHSSRTLEDLEVTDLVDKIVDILKQSFNAKLRD